LFVTNKKYTYFRKILFISFSSIFFASLIAGCFLYFFLFQNAKESETKNFKALAKSIAAQVNKEIAEAKKKLELIASCPAFSALPCVDQIDLNLNGLPENIDSEKRLMLEELRTKSDFSVLFVLKPDGDHYISHPFHVQKNLRKDKYNLSSRPYFQEASLTKNTVISDSFLGADGALAVAINVPILNKSDDIIAHLGGVFHLTSLSKLVSRNKISKFDVGFVVDKQGHAIAHTDIDVVMSDASRKKFSRHPLLRVCKNRRVEQYSSSENGKTFIHIYNDPLDGENYLGSLTPLISGWNLVLVCNVKKIVAEFKSNVVIVTVVVSLLFLSLSSLGFIFIRAVRRRWQKAEEKLAESERQLKEAQKIAKIGHWELTLESNNLVWSDEICRMFGLQPQEFMATYEAFLKRVHPDDRDQVDSKYKASLESKSEYKIEHRIVLKDGSEKWVLARGRTEYDDAGTPVKTLGTVQDITEIKLLRGILPICSSCKKIRDDEGYWTRIESYVYKYSDAVFSHSLCPGCAHKLYPEEYEALYGKKAESIHPNRQSVNADKSKK
jgi:PAS domain S-box-containing protein